MTFGTFTMLWVLSSSRTFSLHFQKEIPSPLKNNNHVVLCYYHIVLPRILFPSHSCRLQWESPKCLACDGYSHCIIIVTERKNHCALTGMFFNWKESFEMICFQNLILHRKKLRPKETHSGHTAVTWGIEPGLGPQLDNQGQSVCLFIPTALHCYHFRRLVYFIIFC